MIPLPVAQLNPTTTTASSSSSSAVLSASSTAGNFCGSPGAESASSSDAGFYEMSGEDIDTTAAAEAAEDFMQFQVRLKIRTVELES